MSRLPGARLNAKELPVTCAHCGNLNKPGARFCTRCGAALAAVLPAYTPPVYTPSAAPPVHAPPYSVPPGSRPGATGEIALSSVLHRRYRLMDTLGKGGMAAVYKAEDLAVPGLLVAVKEMSAAQLPPAELPGAVAAFQREAQVLASLSHPNVVRVHDYFAEGGKQFIVMEYVDGATLEDMLLRRGRPFDEAQALPWLAQLCSALAYLHSRVPPLIYRDLKPQNVMVDRNGLVKLIDFGITRNFDPNKLQDTTRLGTQGYCSPEAFSGQTGPRSDLYSFGATAHRVLTGHDPASTPFQLPPVRSINPAISVPLAQVVDDCLSYDASRRPAVATDVLAAVTGSLYQGSAAGAAVHAALPLPPVAASHRPTTRLIQQAARLTPRQIAIGSGAALVAAVLVIVLLGPWLSTRAPALWRQLPLYLMAGPLAYAAFRRIGPAFLAQTLTTLVVWFTVWLRFDDWPAAPELTGFFLGVLLAGVLCETSFYALDHFTGFKRNPNLWLPEAAWFAGTALLMALAFFLPWAAAFMLGQGWIWAAAPAVGAAGWFLGDLLREGRARRLW